MNNDRYKFRAKRLDNGEWVYGGVIIGNENNFFITTVENGIHVANVPVDPETVGQCATKKDKNGVLIYEGDVIKHIHAHKSIHTIKYDDGYGLMNSGSQFEIIGDSHTTPELLEVKG